MKKTVVLVLALAAWLLPGAAAAQDSAIMGGVKAGLNIATLNEEDLDSKSGIVFGGFVRKAIAETFSAQIEALFSQQGAALDDISVNLRYLQVPVLAMLSFPGESVSPFVHGGMAFGFSLGGDVEYDGESEDLDELSALDVGFVLGAGVDVGRLVLDARYTIGIKDIDNTGDNSKNRVFSITVGFRFR